MSSSPVPQGGVKLKNELFFGFSEDPALQIGPQIVCPSKTAALATAQEPCSTSHETSKSENFKQGH